MTFFGIGDEKTVELLLKAGANASNPGEGDRTPLHNAVKYGYVRIVDMLLKNGANPTAFDEKHNTPLHLLADLEDSQKQYDIAELLVNAGADVNAENYNEETPSGVIFNSKGMLIKTSATALVTFQWELM